MRLFKRRLVQVAAGKRSGQQGGRQDAVRRTTIIDLSAAALQPHVCRMSGFNNEIRRNRCLALPCACSLVQPSVVHAQATGIEWETPNPEAKVLYQAGKYDHAVGGARKSLPVSEENVDPGHPDVARSLENLAVPYRATRQNGEAEVLEKRAVRFISSKP